MRFAKWLIILGMTLSFPLGTFAALDLGATGLTSAGTNAGITTTGTAGSLAGMVGLLVKGVLNLLGVLLFILFLYSGFLWMTAQGDDKQVKKAKDIMRNSAMGLIVILMGYSISFYALTYLSTGAGVSNVGLDKLVTAAGGAGLNTSLTDPLSTVGYYLSLVLNMLGVVLLVLFLYAGWLWMTAQGDSKQTTKAKDIMKNAIAGLVIIVCSRIIVGFIVDQLAGDESGITAFEQSVHIHNGEV